MPNPSTRPLRARTTVPLTGTTHAVKAYLDHSSEFAVAYAQAWLARAGSPKVPVSGVIRAALRRYVDHLQHTQDATTEVGAVARTCRETAPAADDREAAWGRLQDINPAEPLPPYTDVLRGPEVASQVAAINARAEALFDDMAGSNWGRLKRLRPSTPTT